MESGHEIPFRSEELLQATEPAIDDGPLVSEDEIVAVCDFWRAQAKAVYNEQLLEPPKDDAATGSTNPESRATRQ